MNNRKGFTLIELLVTITIIGIIMLIVLPAITNLQRENQKKKFDDYERAVLEAAKAYEDQYEEDLFGRYSEGCAYIDFGSLVEKKLLTTTKISGYECNYDTNGIIIRKVKGKSFYEVYLDCVKGSETKKLTNNSGYKSISRDYCDVGEDKTPPTLEIKCDSDTINGVQGDDFNETGIYYYSATNKGNKKIPELTVKASDSNSGLEKNQYVTYEWKIYNDKAETKQIFTEKNKTIFNTKDGAGSTSKKKVRIIETFKENNTTGKAIVDLYGENIVDRAGNKRKGERKTCTYFYDNVKPQMEIRITGNNSGREYSTTSGEWINEPITTTVTVTDQTENNIYSGIDPDSLTRGDNNETLTGGTETYIFTKEDANRKEDDTYTICDKVGNCTSQTVKIRVDTIYPTCKSRDGDPNWRNQNITINGDCVDQGNPAHYSGCVKNVYSQEYSAEQSIINATAGQACDNAGNCIICTQDQPVHIDKTRPNCTTDGESTDWATSRTIKFNCEDPISGGVRSNCTKTTYETITYTSTTKTTSKTWNIEDNAGNTRTCTKNNNVNVYMDNTDPNCSHSVSGENQAGKLVTISFTCKEPDGEIGSVVAAHYINGGFSNWPVNPGGDSYSNPFTISRQYVQGAYGFLCYNKAGVSCIYAPEIEESRCTSSCCGTHDCRPYRCHCSGGSCDTCYHQCPDTCTSGKCCGYHEK